jgi:hypothetical protein
MTCTWNRAFKLKLPHSDWVAPPYKAWWMRGSSPWAGIPVYFQGGTRNSHGPWPPASEKPHHIQIPDPATSPPPPRPTPTTLHPICNKHHRTPPPSLLPTSHNQHLSTNHLAFSPNPAATTHQQLFSQPPISPTRVSSYSNCSRPYPKTHQPANEHRKLRNNSRR